MPKINPRISSLDDLLGVAREVENTAAAEDKPAQPGNNEIQMLSPEIIRGFRGHPFRLYEGERLNDLVESISENGVLVPAIVRKIEPDENGFEYEMLAGHNRQNAAIAAKRPLPCIIKENLSDHDAWIYVIETNVLQRSFSEMLPSEKAAVLALRYSKMICQGRRNDIMERLHPSEYKRLRETFGHITDDELGAVPLDGILSADELAHFIPGLFSLKEKMPKKGRLAYKLLPEEVKAELDTFVASLKANCKYIGDLVNEYADAKCQLAMLYDTDPAHVEEQQQKGIAEADKLIANKVLEAIRAMLRKDRETGAFEYAEARKAYYTEQMICEILMALEQNAVNMGMEYDDCQKAMGGDLSKAAKKEWYLRHKDRGMEP